MHASSSKQASALGVTRRSRRGCRSPARGRSISRASLESIHVKAHLCAFGGKVKAMIAKIIQINEALAVWLTKTFGTMWICYAFMVYGLLPAFAIFHPYQDAFLYWSNWIQLWSLPLILVGTNILGRDAEERSKLDHEKLAKSYEEQQQTYIQIIAMLKKQEEVMVDLVAQR
jgi:hypothetical protein